MNLAVRNSARVDLTHALAETLRQARREAGLTQAAMAKALRVSRPTITRLENGDQNVTLRTLVQLCRALDCEIGALFAPGGVRLKTRLRRRVD